MESRSNERLKYILNLCKKDSNPKYFLSYFEKIGGPINLTYKDTPKFLYSYILEIVSNTNSYISDWKLLKSLNDYYVFKKMCEHKKYKKWTDVQMKHKVQLYDGYTYLAHIHYTQHKKEINNSEDINVLKDSYNVSVGEIICNNCLGDL